MAFPHPGLLPGPGSPVATHGTASRILAAIDAGSNSIKLLVARTGDGDHLDVLAREKVMVRLGHDTLQTGRLSEEALEAGVACLERFAALARAAGAERILCAATCAVREAENAAELALRVKRRADLDLEVISGEEEARLITRAVRSDFPASADPLLVIDIGGGSTEVILSSAGSAAPVIESLELGAVRLTERYVKTDPVSKDALSDLRDEVARRVRRLEKAIRARGFATAVGTSGTIVALAQLAAARKGRPAGVATGHLVLDRKALDGIVVDLSRTTLREKARIPGLDQKRADILTAGAVLLQVLMERFRIRKLVVSDRSLREGLVLDALDRARSVSGEAPAAETARDVRRESVHRLGRRAHLERPHAEKTRDLALQLFDRTHALHQLAGREREWLEHAAFLHDVGTAIGYRAHHKHTAYLISHAELKGFSATEISVIAQVARYHRKSRPKRSHEAFARLDPFLAPIVEKLAAILRLADALDRSHRQMVTNVDVSVRRRRIVLGLDVAGSPDLELWAAGRKSDLFESVFGRSVEIVVKARPLSLVAREPREPGEAREPS
ncbi:MAG: Ppx/GppA family phosphatase [Acidobacteria bacterium]|nr:Ppx/GppA family phosphatase [Acidobacteriota bacterium]